MADRFLRRAGASEIVRRMAARLVLERQLIADGDRLLIAVSGGKDSTVCAWALSALKKGFRHQRKPGFPFNYELEALHISSDFCSCCKKSALEKQLADWGIPFTDLFVPVIGRLKEGKKMNCYWCSTQRRTELLKYAVERGFNKIVLGHHMDDILETFFMNLCSQGKLSAMPVLLRYRKYPVTLIRPLALLEERQIIACAEEKGILKTACTCPYGANSKRREMREKLAVLTGASGAVKRRMISALSGGPGGRDLLVE